jgi:hypothetical protein
VLDGTDMIARIVMVAHPGEASASSGLKLFAVVEGEMSKCLEKLMPST